MKRTVFYVWWATAEENETGVHHKSHAFDSEQKAQKFSEKMWKMADFVSIDKVREVYENNEWRQEDNTDIETIYS